MSFLMFLSLQEQGHLLPTFKLAKALERRGHRVVFLTDPQQEGFVRAQGHEAVVVDHSFWPAPAAPRGGAAGALDAINEVVSENREHLARLLRELRPGLCLVDGFVPSMALAAYESGSPYVLLHTNLDTEMPGLVLGNIAGRAGIDPALAEAALRAPEMVLCPKAFDFPNAPHAGRTLYFVEASVDLSRREPPFDWGPVDPEEPFVYCSLGSQAHCYPEAPRFFRAVLEAMAAQPRRRMVMSVGKVSPGGLGPVPPNVHLVGWAPQLEVLKKASVMITHGGLGTVKECIFFGVPMIAYPQARDQPLTTARVVFHGLGRRGDILHVTPAQVAELIDDVERNPSYKERTEEMSRKFWEVEESGRGVKVVEKVLEVLGRRKGRGAPDGGGRIG
ncbi:MAG TPA: glycosyltransferase [Pyrinomonadaceae bacterium]|jgi:UDP:flavonoid glycosyltransferase YjiC (YdhE family)